MYVRHIFIHFLDPLTPRGNLCRFQSLQWISTCLFLDCGGIKCGRHFHDIKSPHRNALGPAWESNSGSSFCEVIKLQITKSPCCLFSLLIQDSRTFICEFCCSIGGGWIEVVMTQLWHVDSINWKLFNHWFIHQVCLLIFCLYSKMGFFRVLVMLVSQNVILKHPNYCSHFLIFSHADNRMKRRKYRICAAVSEKHSPLTTTGMFFSMFSRIFLSVSPRWLTQRNFCVFSQQLGIIWRGQNAEVVLWL